MVFAKFVLIGFIIAVIVLALVLRVRRWRAARAKNRGPEFGTERDGSKY